MLETKTKPRGAVHHDAGARGLVLFVDDSPTICTVYERVLGTTERVITASNGHDAVDAVRAGGVDVVVSDITMPGMTGLELLRQIRGYDPDLPVVLITGSPSVESASEAIEYGVFRYLAKPVDGESLRATVRQASQLYRVARIKREALGLADIVGPSDRAGLEVSFERALTTLSVVFQPIVSFSGRSVLAYEALMRSAEPTLPGALDVLDAAERLGAVFELGKKLRGWAGELFLKAPPDRLLFLNLTPRELLAPDLLDPRSALAPIADRVVLEITERASLEHVEDLRTRVALLRARGFRIAVDDLGAGYAGLTSFAVLEPDIVKLDMSLTRGVDQNPIKQKLVGAMTVVCREMATMMVAEGVETEAERDTLIALGCDVLQGFLFAEPGPPFPRVRW